MNRNFVLYHCIPVLVFGVLLPAVSAQDRGIIECTGEQQAVPAWTQPRVSGFVVENLACGQMVSITGLERGYVHVQIGEKHGYVDARYVRVQEQGDQSRRIGELEAQVRDLRRRQQAAPQAPAPRAPAPPRDFSRVEVFGGYSVLRPNLPGNLIPGWPAESGLAETVGEFLLGNVLGWGAGVTVNVNRVFGIRAAFNGYYKGIEGEYEGDSAEARGNLHTFLFGPAFTARAHERVRPYAHALFGFGRVSGSARLNRDSFQGDKTGFAAAVGGGVDVVVNRHLSIRAIEVEFFPYRESNGDTFTFNNLRWSSGLVFGF